MIPFVSSNLWAARMRPRLPSLIRSESDTPWFWYFLATDTTKRRLVRTSLSSASPSPLRIRWARRDLLLLRNQRVRADLAEILVERSFVERRTPPAGTNLHWTHATRPRTGWGGTHATAWRSYRRRNLTNLTLRPSAAQPARRAVRRAGHPSHDGRDALHVVVVDLRALQPARVVHVADLGLGVELVDLPARLRDGRCRWPSRRRTADAPRRRWSAR